MDAEMIVRNPFEFQLATVVVNDSVKREVLSPADEKRFLEWVKEDKHYSRYYDGMFILFKTGLRISEFCGLTRSDIDFENGVIHVDHQLQRTRDMKYFAETTKTSCGTRRIPMTEEVAEAFRRIIANRVKLKVEPMVSGYSGFLFLDKDNKPMLALQYLIGHAEISVTMNVYIHLGEEDAKAEMIKIGLIKQEKRDFRTFQLG